MSLRIVLSVIYIQDVQFLEGVWLNFRVQRQNSLRLFFPSATNMNYLFRQAVRYIYIQLLKLKWVEKFTNRTNILQSLHISQRRTL